MEHRGSFSKVRSPPSWLHHGGHGQRGEAACALRRSRGKLSALTTRRSNPRDLCALRLGCAFAPKRQFLAVPSVWTSLSSASRSSRTDRIRFVSPFYECVHLPSQRLAQLLISRKYERK